MNKRLEKRHKRQVARDRERGKVSEPDLRTPEEIAAARQASGAVANRRTDLRPNYVRPAPNRAGPDATDPVSVDVAA